nr:reverse transcriptase domain-containing protein [Tanacetum cinerariifolium]
ENLIDKLVKEGRLDHLVKNIKKGKDKQKSRGKKDTPKEKADTIYMVQSWQRKTRQKVSQKFSRGSEISFPTLTADNTVVEPLTIEINAGGHDIHRMYIDGRASMDILYEHCFQILRPEVRSQLNPAMTSLTGFTGEKIWPVGQIRLLVIFAIRAVPSTAHGMLKFPVDGGIVTIYNTTVPPRESNTVACDTTRNWNVNVATNDDERRIDLDLLEERRKCAAICEAKAKSKMKGYYDAKVQGVLFRPGDFVYRANGASHAKNAGKLGPKWEGPYEVTEVLGNGAYKLRDMDGRELPRT